MYYNSLYYVFLLLNYFSYQCFAIHCGGGSVLRSELFGGPQDDSIVSVNLDNNKGFRMAGQTSDGTWTGNAIGAMAPDYWVAAVDTATNQSSYRLLDVGQDNLNNAYLNEYYLCIAGASEGLEYIAVWPSSLNISSTPTWSHMGTFTGLNSEEGRAVVCTSTQALLVSAIDSVGNGKPDIVLKSFSMQGDIRNTFTYGGSDTDVPHDSALSGSVLAIVGQTLSANFNVTPGATQTTKLAGNDAFVMTVNVSNGDIIFATYYGGNGDEYADAVALDEAGYVYVCGYTSSQDLVLPNAYSTTQSGISDAWLGIWSPDGTLVFATLFGSDGADQASQIQVMRLYDSSHLVYLTGITDGTNFPSVESFEGNFGLSDAFVLAYRVAPDYSSGSLSFSTRFGGSGEESASGLSVNQYGQIAIGGSTKSSDFPGEGVYQANFDAFYTIFDCPALIPVPPSPSPSQSPSASPVAAVATCQTADGCYQANDLAVKYEQTSNGTYTPTQTLYPVNSTSNTVNNATSLNVAYNVLEEKDANGTVIHSVTFPSDGWQLSVTTEVVGGTSVSVVQFTTVLASGANVTIYNYLFEQDTTFTFANISFPVYASSTESNIKIEGWPFQSEENSLQLKVDLQIVPAPAPAETSVAGSITQYAFDTGVSKAQVSVLSVAVVDDASAPVTTAVSSTQLSVNFPYFANSVIFDPGYTVLVNNEGDKEPKKQKEPISKWAYIGAAIGVVVIAAIFTGFLLTFMKKRQRRQRAKSRAAIQHATEQMNGTNSSSEVSTF